MESPLLSWHWLAAGVGLVVLEILVPGGILIWIGAPLLAVGLVMLAVPELAVAGQLGLFAAFAIASLGAAIFVRTRRKPDAGPAVNAGTRRFIGRTAVVETPITGGRGEIRLDDTVWLASGPELPAGAEVVVTGADGTVLAVRAND